MTGVGALPFAASGAAAFVSSLFLGLYLTPIFRDSARRFGIVDQPDGALKTQKDPVPYLGGLAVFCAVLFPVAIFLQFSDKLMGLLLASSIIVLVGLIDDIGRLSPRIKLLVQVIAVFLMIKSGIRIRIGFLPPLACVALTFLWMIVMTNGFNLIDVMDGLAGGVASVSATALGIILMLQGKQIGMVVCLSLIGALLGFLRYNRTPAQIYLGDTGSLLLGFLLGGLAIEADYTLWNPLGWLTAIAVFAVPLFEIAFVSYLRMRRGASIFVGSRDHFSLRLRKWRLSTGQTVLYSCAAGALSSGIGLAAMHLRPLASLVWYGLILAIFLAVAIWLKAIDMKL
ncbi:MAG: undecaprenyl/decaprenyl-phosphate alpha-N-acetylglucosaminyl 1-phosphate transferase [Deltaproteobacteria bacterium]|nr:undecaprenyl/decaprenyl-phosphate alpha-N-acetylglucosaminyl 1-phosphate transferase [Deltaproteobacteria bacterium]